MIHFIFVLLASSLSFSDQTSLTQATWRSCSPYQKDCYEVNTEKVGQSFIPHIQFAKNVEITLNKNGKTQKAKSERAFYYPQQNKWVLLPSGKTLDGNKMQLK